MLNKDTAGIYGRYTFKEYDAEGNHLATTVVDNQITTAFLNLLRDGVMDADSVQATYIAAGSGNTAPTASDTTLVTEEGRVAVSTTTAGTDGVGTVEAVFGTGDANVGALEEFAVFGGPTATATADTGTMLSRVLQSSTKDDTVTITAAWEVTFAEGV